MIIFLFSLKSYKFWLILIAHLLLHDFLHLFIYDASKKVCPLISYSTKIATAAQFESICFGQVREDDDYFTCITKAFEILGNPVRRRAFDSVDPLFDDTVPAVLAKDKAEADFFATFGPVFDRNARWSNKTPVPLLGTPAATV
jgi:hypothetical protein